MRQAAFQQKLVTMDSNGDERRRGPGDGHSRWRRRTRATAATRVARSPVRHYAVINGLAGALLIVMGVLVLTGELTGLNAEAQSLLDDLDLNFFQEI